MLTPKPSYRSLPICLIACLALLVCTILSGCANDFDSEGDSLDLIDDGATSRTGFASLLEAPVFGADVDFSVRATDEGLVGTANVAVVDQSGESVSGVAVHATFVGHIAAEVVATTDQHGVARFESPVLSGSELRFELEAVVFQVGDRPSSADIVIRGGDKGASGSTGATGNCHGEKGASGSTGVSNCNEGNGDNSNAVGSDGDKGTSGSTGATQETENEKGASGSTGGTQQSPESVEGDGASGSSGVVGPNGDKGASGSTGTTQPPAEPVDEGGASGSSG